MVHGDGFGVYIFFCLLGSHTSYQIVELFFVQTFLFFFKISLKNILLDL